MMNTTSTTSTTLTSSTNNKTDGFIFKIVIIGDISVGKTNIIKRFTGGDFIPTEATIGVDFSYIQKHIHDNDSITKINLHLWDTSGAERFKAITISHIRNADGAFIVYDITNRNSFESIKYWYDYIKMSANEDIVLYLLGNKSDLSSQRMVDIDEVKEAVKNMKITLIEECSAKTNEGIMPIFEQFYNGKLYIMVYNDIEVYNKNKHKVVNNRKEHKQLFETTKKEAEHCC